MSLEENIWFECLFSSGINFVQDSFWFLRDCFDSAGGSFTNKGDKFDWDLESGIPNVGVISEFRSSRFENFKLNIIRTTTLKGHQIFNLTQAISHWFGLYLRSFIYRHHFWMTPWIIAKFLISQNKYFFC